MGEVIPKQECKFENLWDFFYFVSLISFLKLTQKSNTQHQTSYIGVYLCLIFKKIDKCLISKNEMKIYPSSPQFLRSWNFNLRSVISINKTHIIGKRTMRSTWWCIFCEIWVNERGGAPATMWKIKEKTRKKNKKKISKQSTISKQKHS